MHLRFLVLNTLILVGCGGTTPKENSPVPFIEIAPGDKLVAAEPVTNDEENDIPTAFEKVPEGADGCRASMREGRGLPRDALASEAGKRYLEALTHERAERLNEARKGYLSVVMQYPQSPLVPLVYFAFGELFFQEAQSDPPKVPLAEQAYREVTKYPAPENTATAFTLFRLAQLFGNGGKGPEALNMLNKFMTLAETYPDAQCVKSLGDSARTLMVKTYADVGQPNRAFEFFARSSRTGGKANAFDMVASLCELYIAQQKPESAAEALVALNGDHASPTFCVREKHIIARLSESNSAIVREKFLRMHAARCE